MTKAKLSKIKNALNVFGKVLQPSKTCWCWKSFWKGGLWLAARTSAFAGLSVGSSPHYMTQFPLQMQLTKPTPCFVPTDTLGREQRRGGKTYNGYALAAVNVARSYLKTLNLWRLKKLQKLPIYTLGSAKWPKCFKSILNGNLWTPSPNQWKKLGKCPPWSCGY